MMTVDIEHMSLEELVQLNKQVVRRIRYLHEKKTSAELEQFAVGDRVSFQGNGRAVEGIVVRVNRKSVSVHTEDGHWNIHPKLLTKLSKAEGSGHGEQAWKQGFLRRMGMFFRVVPRTIRKDQDAKLRELADKTGRSLSELVKKAIEGRAIP